MSDRGPQDTLTTERGNLARLAAALGTGNGAKLTITQGEGVGREIELRDTPLIVGRSSESDLRLLRRLQRDMSDRGRSFEKSVEQYLETVRPMHELFVEPSKRFADIIIPASQPNEKAIKMIVDMVHRRADRHS